jgi:hypothetical protein
MRFDPEEWARVHDARDPAALAAALRRAGLVPEREILYAHFAGAGDALPGT